MTENKIPCERMVFVCTNSREEGRIACANVGRGGQEIYEKLKEAIKQQGLQGKIRVAHSGCLTLCQKGPNLFIYPDNLWLSDVREEDVPSILNILKK